MSAEDSPKYVYKIITEAPLEPIPEEFPLSQLDATDGFVHFSTATQVPQTCDLFFTNVTELWVLKLDYKLLSSDIKWENGFPHLYRNFGAKEFISFFKYTRADGEKWSKMKSSTWLDASSI